MGNIFLHVESLSSSTTNCIPVHKFSIFPCHFCSGMILKNHTYLKVYKCWQILPILKTPTIKWLAIFFKKYFNFQGFYFVYIIIWRFLGWKKFTPSKLGKTELQKMQNGEYFFGEKLGKIAHGINFTPKIIPGLKFNVFFDVCPFGLRCFCCCDRSGSPSSYWPWCLYLLFWSSSLPFW